MLKSPSGRIILNVNTKNTSSWNTTSMSGVMPRVASSTWARESRMLGAHRRGGGHRRLLVLVELGGKVTRVKTYGELITAIINPSHELAKGYAEDVVAEEGESRMYVYNEFMTVQELIDVVMFLQPYYDVVVPQYTYRIYP